MKIYVILFVMDRFLHKFIPCKILSLIKKVDYILYIIKKFNQW